MLLNILRSYRELPRNIHLLFLLEFSLSLIHVAFILILNIYLRKQGFTDPEIASFNSLRFIGALAFALPLGIYIRGKRLKPFFKLAAIIVPITSAMIIESIHFSIVPLIQLSFLCWGVGMMLMRVCSLPFIIRNTTADNSTEALSLSAATWSLATIFSGLIIFATSAQHYLVNKKQWRGSTNNTMLIIDLGVPRNVDPELASELDLITVDGLKEIAEKNIKKRKGEKDKILAIISDELEHLHSWKTYKQSYQLIPK